MNKIYLGIVAGLLLLAGCSENDQMMNKENGGMKSFTSLTATIAEDADTRAYIMDGAGTGQKMVGWSDGDEISVFSDTESNFTRFQLSNANGNEGEFEGYQVSGEEFYALYPSNGWTLDPTVAGRLRFDFDYNGRTVVPGNGYLFRAPMLAVSNNNSFAFKQLTGMIHVTVNGLYGVSTIGIEGNNNEVISGPGYVDFTEAEPVFKLDENRANTRGYGMGYVNPEGYAELYFVLPPMTLNNGFKIYVEGYDRNNNPVSFNKTYSSSLEIERARVKHFPIINVDDEIVEPEPVEYLAIIPHEEDPVDYVVFGSDGTSYLYTFNEENENLPEQLTLYDGNNDEIALNVRFNEDGLPISIISDDFTIAIGGHVGNTFKAVVVTKDGETAIYEDVTMDMSWEEYLANLEGDAQTRALSRSPIKWVNAVVGSVGCGLSVAATIASAPTGVGAVLGWGLTTISCSSAMLSMADALGADIPVDDATMAGITGFVTLASCVNVSDPLGVASCVTGLVNDVTTIGDIMYDAAHEDLDLAESALVTGNGSIKMTLTWDNYADIDIHVIDPTGYHIYYADMWSTSGGYLDYDNTWAYGPENIYFNPAPDGQYHVYLHYYKENEGVSSVNYKVSIYIDGVGKTYSGTISGQGSVVDIATFTYGNPVTTRSSSNPFEIDWNNLPPKNQRK